MLRSLGISLVLTVLAETLLARLVLGLRDRHDLGTVALAQVVTNPLVVLLAAAVGWVPSPPLVSTPWAIMLLLEACAALAEGRIYAYDKTFGRPYAASALLNAASFCIGLLLAWVIG